jgi:hypothetical protein
MCAFIGTRGEWIRHRKLDLCKRPYHSLRTVIAQFITAICWRFNVLPLDLQKNRSHDTALAMLYDRTSVDRSMATVSSDGEVTGIRRLPSDRCHFRRQRQRRRRSHRQRHVICVTAGDRQVLRYRHVYSVTLCPRYRRQLVQRRRLHTSSNEGCYTFSRDKFHFS